jgi:uncharacterized protein with FMN-binding domain
MKTLLVTILILCFSHAFSHAFDPALEDGTYEGEHSFVKVLITVTDGKVSDIFIASHGGGGEEYALMVEPLAEEMVERQTTYVEAVTGATVSSEHLKKAVEDAIKKASGK